MQNKIVELYDLIDQIDQDRGVLDKEVVDIKITVQKGFGEYEYRVPKGYNIFTKILLGALEQTASPGSKGNVRHNKQNLSFDKQPIQTIPDLLKDQGTGGLAYQVIKKVTESLGFEDKDKAIHELHGAMVYLTSLIMYIQKQKDNEKRSIK